MKRLSLLLFLIPNLVIAETWVCSSSDEEVLNYFQRFDEKSFYWDFENTKYDITYESNNIIKLINSSLEVGEKETIILSKQKNTWAKSIKLDSGIVTWSGTCEVIE